MNWGIKIIIAFICFIGVIFTMVYISMNQDISLVADNYYEQELAYEEQIQRIKNNNELPDKPEFKVYRQESRAELIFPEEIRDNFKEGTIHFFRPSNAKLDKAYAVSLGSEGIQQINLSDFQTGLWKVKISWKSVNKEYYKELNMVL